MYVLNDAMIVPKVVTIVASNILVQAFPKYVDPAIFNLLPAHRLDCSDSDECCVRITYRYFDLLPVSEWNRDGPYPVESWSRNNLRSVELTLDLDKQYHRLSDTTSCKFSCRDTSTGSHKMRIGRVDLRRIFSMGCAVGYQVAFYREFSRHQLDWKRRLLKCKCVVIDTITLMSNEGTVATRFPDIDRAVMSSTTITSLFEHQRTIIISAAESDCVDVAITVPPLKNPRQIDLDILAAAEAIIDSPTGSPRQSSRMKADLTSIRIPWTEIMDITQQQTIHRSGSNAQIHDAEIDHEYRACSVAPETAAARLLAKSYWTPI